MSNDPIKLRVGFDKDHREVTANPTADDPRPWDLDTAFDQVGKRHPRQDALKKVTGAAKYSLDQRLPGMLIGGFYRSPHARAKITKIDYSLAEKHPEVKAVYEMQVTTIRYAGQPVLAFAAETRQGLEEAIRLVKVEYEVERHAATVALALADDAPLVHGNRANVTQGRAAGSAENVAKMIDAADASVEITCTTQVQTHNSLETHGCVAHWVGQDLTIWASTQATFGFRGQIGSALQSRGIKYDNIRVLSEFVGGGFGSKFAAGYHGLAACVLAHTAQRPVKLLLNRREEHTDTGNRPSTEQVMKLGVSKDGSLGAYKIHTSGTPGIGRGAGATNPMIYEFAAVAKTAQEVATNAGPSAAFRAPGHPEGSFGLECIIDLAAEAIGMDPVAFRRKNDPHPVRQAQYDDGATRIGWSRRQKTGAQSGRFRTGFGVAATRWRQYGGPRAEVQVKIRKDGVIEARSGAQDIGTGTRTLIAIIVAEDLGLPVDRIASFIGDTTDPIGPASGGSTTAPSIAPAARQAAYLAGRELRTLAAAHLECQPEDLVLKNGHVVHAKDEKKSMTFTDACRLIRGDELTAMGKRERNWDDAMYLNEVGGVQFAEVVVDTHFGNVQVKKIVALQDAGTIINHLAAESQVNGAVIQGLSWALFEERHIDRQRGLMVNPDMEMYKIAGPMDMPEIETVLYDVRNGGNTTGVAGLGEPPMIPTAAAIGGAVHNALGIRIPHLPITPDKVLMALEAQEKGR